ncbi:type III-A CRISPR-associated RAMP protein Csm5 [Pyrococcus kukulkanii]|uniref:CRISPR system Cms protein Csm5 n=1 Tax=Pyrococcus kukulkanii TaxID=1609559 RepID=A0ABV4T3U8_9EURY
MIKRTIILKTLSPLHIGNGHKLTPVDIYPKGNIIHILDVEKLVRTVINRGANPESVLTILRYLPQDYYIWRRYINDLNLPLEEFTLYTLPVHGEIGKTRMEIHEFMKLDGKPYIPGSSIKGAIRTAIFYKVLKECGDSSTAKRLVLKVIDRKIKIGKGAERLIQELGQYEDLIEFYISYLLQERVNYGKADDILEAIVFGMEYNRHSGIRYEPKRDPLRALIVRDSTPIGRTNLVIYRIDTIGISRPIPIWAECLKPGTSTEIELGINEELLQLNSTYFNGLFWECLNHRDQSRLGETFLDFIQEAIREFYTDIVKEELSNLEIFGKYKKDVLNFYNSILNRKHRMVMRLGWGKGWISNTIGLLLKRKGQKWESVRKKLGLGKKPKGKGISSVFPKTRRIADGMPMGWVEL